MKIQTILSCLVVALLLSGCGAKTSEAGSQPQPRPAASSPARPLR